MAYHVIVIVIFVIFVMLSFHLLQNWSGTGVSSVVAVGIDKPMWNVMGFLDNIYK